MKKKQENVDEMTPILVFEGGMSFGELSLLNRKPRAGTVVTLTDCYFAVIHADSYEKLIKKDVAMKMARNVKFLRQIPYMQNWLIKETQGIYMFCRERKFERRN